MDDDIIQRAKAGDRLAFDGLVGPLAESAYRLAFAILLDRQEAEDAVQEAALRAWTKLGTFRAGREFRPWFLKVVANQARTQLRSRWRSVLRLWFPQRLSGPVVDQIAAGMDLRRGLLQLAPRDRALLVLHYYHDLPLDQVAGVLGISESAAKTRLYRALRRLRPKIDAAEVGA